ncbi:hypothetical protein GCM10014713_01040 [Streptomyces purpureus]|uniref:Uncharacterized protein n=1 Tax=Streptomyces purpureus TaxID=1951 RepID=A0A918GXK1_9ACTN|nr:hypothetical protein GCM10014713_01040 [Streptomyces purpureus]
MREAKGKAALGEPHEKHMGGYEVSPERNRRRALFGRYPKGWVRHPPCRPGPGVSGRTGGRGL